MAVLKVCFLLFALLAFTLANPTTQSPDDSAENDDDIATDGTADESEFPDAGEVLGQADATVEGVSLEGLSQAEQEALLSVEEKLAETALDKAVENGESSSGDRKKRSITHTFRVRDFKAVLDTAIINQNIFFLRLAGGTYHHALVQFKAYHHAGAFSVVKTLLNEYRRPVGLVGFIRNSAHRVVVRQAARGLAPSLTFVTSRGYNRWTSFKYYYVPCH